MTSNDVNVNEIAKAAGVSWSTAERRLNDKNKGYSKTKTSKVDKVRHIIIDILNDNKITITTQTGFYNYIKRENPELVDFKVGSFK